MNNPFQELTNNQLNQVVQEYLMTSIPEDALIRKIVLEFFGEINILVLQMNQLLWSLILVLNERLQSFK